MCQKCLNPHGDAFSSVPANSTHRRAHSLPACLPACLRVCVGVCVHLPQTTDHINPKRWAATELTLQLNNLAERQRQREREAVAFLSTVQTTFNNSEWTGAERHCRLAETSGSPGETAETNSPAEAHLRKNRVQKLEGMCVFFLLLLFKKEL